MVRALVQDAPGAVVVVCVPTGEAVDGDARARVRRVDEHSTAEIEADVVDSEWNELEPDPDEVASFSEDWDEILQAWTT